MRMRRIAAVLLAGLLMISAAFAEDKEDFPNDSSDPFTPQASEETAETAMQLRFGIESRYHVSVLTGEECMSVPTSGFELRIIPRGSAAFRWMYDGEEQYTEVLRSLDKALSAYPAGFFRNFRSAAGETARLQFLIGDRIVRNGEAYGAMTASDDAGHSSVFLAADAADIEASVHHALWYVMEARILFKAPTCLKDWNDLNPQDFAYEEEESILPQQPVDPEDWFVSEESKQNEKEDRATVFEAYMTRDSGWWNTRPHLKEKLEYLLVRIQGVFKEKGAFRSPP